MIVFLYISAVVVGVVLGVLASRVAHESRRPGHEHVWYEWKRGCGEWMKGNEPHAICVQGQFFKCSYMDCTIVKFKPVVGMEQFLDSSELYTRRTSHNG